jgi:hypothetical protein
MMDPRAGALATSHVSPFALPRRPSRGPRRSDSSEGAARRLIRAIRREVARSTDEPASTWLPRLTNYPY